MLTESGFNLIESANNCGQKISQPEINSLIRTCRSQFELIRKSREALEKVTRIMGPPMEEEWANQESYDQAKAAYDQVILTLSELDNLNL